MEESHDLIDIDEGVPLEASEQPSAGDGGDRRHRKGSRSAALDSSEQLDELTDWNRLGTCDIERAVGLGGGVQYPQHEIDEVIEKDRSEESRAVAGNWDTRQLARDAGEQVKFLTPVAVDHGGPQVGSDQPRFPRELSFCLKLALPVGIPKGASGAGRGDVDDPDDSLSLACGYQVATSDHVYIVIELRVGRVSYGRHVDDRCAAAYESLKAERDEQVA